MDQKKSNLPVMAWYTKDESPFVQRIIGVKFKVHAVRNYVFLADETIPGGSTLICEILRLILNDLEKRNELPYSEPTLYLQFDNCGENKNKVLIDFVTDLVRRGVFVKAKLGFLMVGHTHEDIDQFFSIISIHLKKETVVCPDQHSLRIEIPNAFLNPVNKPDVIVLDPSKCLTSTSCI